MASTSCSTQISAIARRSASESTAPVGLCGVLVISTFGFRSRTSCRSASTSSLKSGGASVSGAGTARTLAAGTCGYICDDLGVHKVGNATAKGSLSLHVYAPGWVAVSLYREVHGEVDAGGAPIDVDAWGDF